MGKDNVIVTALSESAQRGFIDAVDQLQTLRDMARAVAAPGIVLSGSDQVAATAPGVSQRGSGERGV